MVGKIFISYRRDDVAGHAGRVQDRLAREFGSDLLFMDVDSIPLGVNFIKVLRDEVAKCEVLLAVIGPNWLSVNDEGGRRRLDDPNDFVRIEIATALQRDIPVIPILLNRTRMPKANQLPKDLRELAARNALEVRDVSFHSDMDKLIRGLKGQTGQVNSPAAVPLPPEEHRREQETETPQRAEQEQHRKAAEIETRRLVEQKRLHREAEAAQLPDEEGRQKTAELEAQECEVEERGRQKSAGEQRANEERVFTAAERSGTVAALDAFPAANPESHLAGEALKLKAVLLERGEAYRLAVESDDPAQLRSFLATYPEGSDASQVRARLGSLEPHQWWPPSRPVMAISGTLAVVIVAALLFWFENRPGVPSAQKANTPRPQVQEKVAGVTPLVAGNAQTWPQVPPATPPNSTSSLPAPPAPASAPKIDNSTTCRANSQQIAATGGEFNLVTLRPASGGAKKLRAIAISPDGTRVVSAGDDGVIRIWDAANMKWIQEIRGEHTAEVYSVAFSGDGRMLASASLDGTIRIWDGHSFAPMQTFLADGGNAPVEQYGVEFEPGSNPRYVVSVGADGNVWIWDISNGRLARKRPSGDSTVRSLSFAPKSNGEFVTADFDGKIRFFAGSGKVDAVSADTGKVLHVAYSPDGMLVASAGVDPTNKTVKVFNVSSRTLFKAYEGHRGYAVSVVWSRDGKLMASGGGDKDRTVRLWDVQSGKQLQMFTGHNADVEAVAFHPNQKWLISASEDTTMKIWDIASGKALLTIVGFEDGQYLAYAPNGCYTGSANAPNYVTFVMTDSKGRELDVTGNSKDTFFVPHNSPDVLLPR